MSNFLDSISENLTELNNDRYVTLSEKINKLDRAIELLEKEREDSKKKYLSYESLKQILSCRDIVTQCISVRDIAKDKPVIAVDILDGETKIDSGFFFFTQQRVCNKIVTDSINEGIETVVSAGYKTYDVYFDKEEQLVLIERRCLPYECVDSDFVGIIALKKSGAISTYNFNCKNMCIGLQFKIKHVISGDYIDYTEHYPLRVV